MSHVTAPKDLLAGYAWMRSMVTGLETQSIKTVRGSDYGEASKTPLVIRAGWEKAKNETENAKSEYNLPYARTLSDHTTILGAVRWHEGGDERALVIPKWLAPFEEYTFTCYYDTYEPVILRVTPSGYLYAPTGINSPIVLSCRYPTPREGG